MFNINNLFMKFDQNKKILVAGLAAVTLLSAYIIFLAPNFSAPIGSELGLNPDDTALRAGVVPTVSTQVNNIQDTSAKLSYGEAVKTYPYHFQFINCAGSPGTINTAAGGKVMLDNRDNISHKITVGDKNYTVAAYIMR